MAETTRTPRFKLDGTVSLGNIISMGSVILAMVWGWSQLVNDQENQASDIKDLNDNVEVIAEKFDQLLQTTIPQTAAAVSANSQAASRNAATIGTLSTRTRTLENNDIRQTAQFDAIQDSIDDLKRVVQSTSR